VISARAPLQPTPPDLAAALKECRRAFLSVAFFSGAANMLMLAGPLYMLQVYDRVLASRSVPTLVALSLLLLLAYAFQGGLDVIDFTDANHPYEIAYFDRGPVDAEKLVTAGFWAGYWYNGHIIGSEIAARAAHSPPGESFLIVGEPLRQQFSAHARLAGSLEALGYATERRGKHWDVACVGRPTVEKFSRRTAQIEQVAAEQGIVSPDAKARLGQTTRVGQRPAGLIWKDRIDQGNIIAGTLKQVSEQLEQVIKDLRIGHLNARYTFDDFVIGNPNRFAPPVAGPPSGLALAPRHQPNPPNPRLLTCWAGPERTYPTMSNSTLRQARRRRRRDPPYRTPTTTTDKVTEPTVPVGALSIYDPIHLGIDENGMPVAVTLAYRNLLAGGEPGAGKSSVLNLIVGHGALSPDCRLWLFDGKRVELGPWRDVADVFVGSDTDHAISKLRELQAEMEIRYAMLEAVGRRACCSCAPATARVHRSPRLSSGILPPARLRHSARVVTPRRFIRTRCG